MAVVNDIISKNSKPNKFKKLLNNVNNEKPAYILANQFNNYFLNVVSDLVMQLKNRIETSNSNISNIFSNNKLLLNKFEPITTDDILERTAKLKNGSSSGLNKTTTDLLKNIK